MNRKKVFGTLIGFLLLLIGFLLYFSARWYLFNFSGQGAISIVFTLLSGLNGVEGSLVRSFVQRAGIMTAACTVLVTLFFCHPGRFRLSLVRRKSGKRIVLSPIRTKHFVLLSAVLCVILTVAAAFAIDLPQWLASISVQSEIFDTEYVDPRDTTITFPERKRNLVYIYLESVETTFFSKEQGGSMDTCIIPELYTLAAENTNFSSTDQVGGWDSITGGTWTTAGLINQIGGIPLLLPFGQAGNEKMNRVLPGATLLWDILAKEGYYQAFMIGSQKEFSDQVKLTEQHGINALYDYNRAIADGFLPDDYFIWWGMEDEKLFTYARQELTAISQQEQPFSFTLRTVDTHFPDGFLCHRCEGDRTEQYENVYACSSAQVAEFVAWLQQQPFYENTTVILCGDHLSMDQDYFRRTHMEDAVRQVYNCILNAPIPPRNNRNRTFTALDFYPTTLAALGCTIDGDRLALGTNLYSGLPTLAERIGLDALNQEMTQGTLPYLYKFLLE